jgi:hypothetical protein
MSQSQHFLHELVGSMSQGADGNPTVVMVEAAFRHHGQAQPRDVFWCLACDVLACELDDTLARGHHTRDGIRTIDSRGAAGQLNTTAIFGFYRESDHTGHTICDSFNTALPRFSINCRGNCYALSCCCCHAGNSYVSYRGPCSCGRS